MSPVNLSFHQTALVELTFAISMIGNLSYHQNKTTNNSRNLYPRSFRNRLIVQVELMEVTALILANIAFLSLAHAGHQSRVCTGLVFGVQYLYLVAISWSFVAALVFYRQVCNFVFFLVFYRQVCNLIFFLSCFLQNCLSDNPSLNH